MTVETLPCADPDCDRRVQLDENYVRVDAHLIRTDDRNGQDDFYFHPRCWDEMTREWCEP